MYSSKVGKGLMSNDAIYDLWLIVFYGDDDEYHASILFIFVFLFFSSRHVGNGCYNGWAVLSPTSFSRNQVLGSPSNIPDDGFPECMFFGLFFWNTILPYLRKSDASYFDKSSNKIKCAAEFILTYRKLLWVTSQSNLMCSKWESRANSKSNQKASSKAFPNNLIILVDN